MKNKSNTSVRLTPEGAYLLKGLAKKLGLSQTDIIELAVRAMGKKEKVKYVEEGKQ